MTDLREEVLACLDAVQDPCSVVNGTPMGLVDMGLVESVVVDDDGDIDICLRLTSPFCEMIGFMRKAAIERIAVLDGAGTVNVRTDSGLDWSPERMSPEAQERRRQRLLTLRGMASPDERKRT